MPGQDNQKIKKLDPEKLNSETTDINDRADYYEKYVTEPGDNMDEEERSKYRVTLHMVYKNAEQYQQDMIIFLRNDNVVEGSMDVGEPDIGLLPGVFRVISMMIEGHDSNLERSKPWNREWSIRLPLIMLRKKRYCPIMMSISKHSPGSDA